MEGYYWPEGVERKVTVRTFEQVFGMHGYKVCENGVLEDGIEKIALYAKSDPDGCVRPTHAARQLPDGRWTSKLGCLEDVIHEDTNGVSGPSYGDVICYFYRRRQQAP